MKAYYRKRKKNFREPFFLNIWKRNMETYEYFWRQVLKMTNILYTNSTNISQNFHGHFFKFLESTIIYFEFVFRNTLMYKKVFFLSLSFLFFQWKILYCLKTERWKLNSWTFSWCEPFISLQFGKISIKNFGYSKNHVPLHENFNKIQHPNWKERFWFCFPITGFRWLLEFRQEKLFLRARSKLFLVKLFYFNLCFCITLLSCEISQNLFVLKSSTWEEYT